MGNTAFTKSTIITPVSVPNGGTGVVSLDDHAVLLGNGTGDVNTTGPGTTGQVLRSNGNLADPTFQNYPFVVNDNFTGKAVADLPVSSSYLNSGATATYKFGGYVNLLARTAPESIRIQVSFTDEAFITQTEILTSQRFLVSTLDQVGLFTFPDITIRVLTNTTIVMSVVEVASGGTISFDCGFVLARV